MAIRRYSRAPVIAGGLQQGTSSASRIIKSAVDAGQLETTVRTLQGNERLDVLAGIYYGDSQSWWIIAAASGIGWGLQVPPGTRIVIPTDLGQIKEIVG